MKTTEKFEEEIKDSTVKIDDSEVTETPEHTE